MIDVTLPPSRIRQHIIRCITKGTVPFVKSSPGLGKSSLTHGVAKDGNLKVIDMRLSQCAPEDLQGLPFRNPETNRAEFLPFSNFPLESDPVPDGYSGWLLFLDEFNSASKSVQAAAYKLTLDRMVGDFKLHPKCAIVCAGNLETDGAIVTRQGTAMQSRVIHMQMRPDKDEWVKWAIKAGIDQRIIAFIEWQPPKLHQFNPQHEDQTFACPRTWEFASRLIDGTKNLADLLELLAGTISAGVAVEFVKFSEEFLNIPSYAQIKADPKKTAIPVEPSTRFATVASVLYNCKAEDLDDMMVYINRFDPEERVVFFKSIKDIIPSARDNPDYAQSMIDLMRFIKQED